MLYDIYRRQINTGQTFERMADPDEPDAYLYEDESEAHAEARTLHEIDPDWEYAVIPVQMPVGSEAWNNVLDRLAMCIADRCADLYEGHEIYNDTEIIYKRDKDIEALKGMGLEWTDIVELVKITVCHGEYMDMLTITETESEEEEYEYRGGRIMPTLTNGYKNSAVNIPAGQTVVITKLHPNNTVDAVWSPVTLDCEVVLKRLPFTAFNDFESEVEINRVTHGEWLRLAALKGVHLFEFNGEKVLAFLDADLHDMGRVWVLPQRIEELYYSRLVHDGVNEHYFAIGEVEDDDNG